MQLHFHTPHYSLRIVFQLLFLYSLLPLAIATETTTAQYQYNTNRQTYFVNHTSGQSKKLDDILDHQVTSMLNNDDIKQKIAASKKQENSFVTITIPFKRNNEKLDLVIKLYSIESTNVSIIEKYYENRKRLVLEVGMPSNKATNEIISKIKSKIKKNSLGQYESTSFNQNLTTQEIANRHINQYKSKKSTNRKAILTTSPLYGANLETMLKENKELAFKNGYLQKTTTSQDANTNTTSKKLLCSIDSNKLIYINTSIHPLNESKNSTIESIVSELRKHMNLLRVGDFIFVPVIERNDHVTLLSNLGKSMSELELDIYLDEFSPFSYLRIECSQDSDPTPNYSNALNDGTSYSLLEKNVVRYNVNIRKNHLSEDIRSLVTALKNKELDPNTLPYSSSLKKLYQDARLIRSDMREENYESKQVELLLAHTETKNHIAKAIQKILPANNNTGKVFWAYKDKKGQQKLMLFVAANQGEKELKFMKKDQYIEAQIPQDMLANNSDLASNSNFSRKVLNSKLASPLTPLQQVALIEDFNKHKSLLSSMIQFKKGNNSNMLLLKSTTPTEQYTFAYQIPELIVPTNDSLATSEKDIEKNLFNNLELTYLIKGQAAILAQFSIDNKPPVTTYISFQEVAPDSELDDFKVNVLGSTRTLIQGDQEVTHIDCICYVAKGYLNPTTGRKKLPIILENIKLTIGQEYKIAEILKKNHNGQETNTEDTNIVPEKFQEIKKTANMTFPKSSTDSDNRYQKEHFFYNWSQAVINTIKLPHSNKSILLNLIKNKTMITYSVTILDDNNVHAFYEKNDTDKTIQIAPSLLNSVDQLTKTMMDATEGLSIPLKLTTIEAEKTLLSKLDTTYGKLEENDLNLINESILSQNDTIQEIVKKEIREMELPDTTQNVIGGTHILQVLSKTNKLEEEAQKELLKAKHSSSPVNEKKYQSSFHLVYRMHKKQQKSDIAFNDYVEKINIDNLTNPSNIFDQIQHLMNEVTAYRYPKNSLEKGKFITDLWNAVAHMIRKKLEEYKVNQGLANRTFMQWLKDSIKIRRQSTPLYKYKKGIKLLKLIEKKWKYEKSLPVRVNMSAQNVITEVVESVAGQIDQSLKPPLKQAQVFRMYNSQLHNDDEDSTNIDRCYSELRKKEEGFESTKNSIERAPHTIWIVSLVVIGVLIAHLIYRGITALFRTKKNSKKQPIEYPDPEPKDLDLDDDEEEDKQEESK